MSEERRSLASIGAKMRGTSAGGWGAWGGTRLPATGDAAPAAAVPKLLIVSEAAAARQARREAIAALAAEAFEAATGAEALRLAREHDFALALLDKDLPDMDGFELASLLRQEPRGATVPLILVLPAGATADQLRTAYRMGAVDGLVTPVDAEILRQKARVFLDLNAQGLRLRAALERAETTVRQVSTANQRLQDQQEIIRNQATHDLLTGLPSRVLLEDRLDGALKRAARNRLRVAVAVVDLDGFKQVNDAHGHSTGDELITATGQRLRQTVRASDTVARLCADEFAVVLEGLHSASAAEHLGHKMAAAVTQPCTLLVELEGRPVDLAPKASVGLAIYPDHGGDREALVTAAETAMYQAKRAGGGVHVYNEGIDAGAVALIAGRRKA